MPSHATAGTNQTLSFSGRLSAPAGGVVPDGYYNIQFKIYQDGAGTTAGDTGGTLKWTESYINNGGTSGVQVKNGYFSVTLGSLNPFGSSIDWNQDTLWLSMNVAGTSASCTTFGTSPCSADGEMLPMKQLTSTPYAMNAGRLGGLTSSGFIQNTTSVQTADFNISGTGVANLLQSATSVTAPAFDRASSGTLSIGTANATTVNIANNDAAHTINIGTGNAAQTLTLGSAASTSSTTIQGGSNGVQVASAGVLSLATTSASGASSGITISTGDSSGAAAGSIVLDTGSGTVSQSVIANKTFESSLNGIQSWFDSTVAQSTAQVHGGTKSLAMTAGASFWGIQDSSPYISITAGHDYTLSMWVRAATHTADITVRAYWVSTGGTYDDIVTETDSTTGWTHITAQFTAPANSTAIDLAMYNSDGSANVGDVHYFDDLSITDLSVSGSSQSVKLGASNAQAVIIGNTLQANATDIYGGSTGINLNSNVYVTAGNSLTLAGGDTSTRPSSPTEGAIYYDTTTHQLLQWNGGKWVSDRSEAVIVAASDSSQADKDAADYVADGNGGGANDGDQVQINAALSAASGKKVVLLAGTYTADATITIPNNTTLAGVGQGTVIKLADLDATDNLIENSDTSTGTGVTIQDLKLDGQDTLNTTGTQYGIYFNNMGDYSASRVGSTIRNVSVNNFRSIGIFYYSSDNNTLSGTTINGMDSTGATFGVYLDNSPRNNNITGNIFLSNTYAIRADGSGNSNSSYTNNTFRSNSYGILLWGASNNTVSGNNFDNTTNHSVDLYNATTLSTYNQVTGNTFNGDGSAVVIDNTSDNIVSSNKINDDGGSTSNNAIVVNNDANRNQITGNSITDSSCSTTCYAMSITSASADATYLSNNTLGTNGTINDTGTGTVYANQVDANGKLINKSAAGASVQTSTNSTTAFQVQNASGTSALTVDTTTNSVLVAGTVDTTTAAGLTIGSSTATSITIGKSASNVTTTLLGNIVVKPTTGNNSTTAFQLQRADGTAMFIADSTNQTITIGNSTDKTVISTSTGTITKYGNARNTKKITLVAEYNGSVLDPGSGSNNSGIMTSSLDLTNRMNYYKWTTTQATNQSYDVVVQVPIPSDFDGWSGSNPLSVTDYTSNTSNGTLTLEARDSSGTVQCNFVSITPGSTSTWTTNNSACTLSSGTYTPGDYMTLRIRMQSPTSGDVRLGNINLSYLSKY